MVRSECAEFDRRAVPGMVHSSDVELGTCRATRRRVMVSSNPYGGRLRWTRWRFVTLLSHSLHVMPCTAEFGSMGSVSVVVVLLGGSAPGLGPAARCDL
jgi:hypothetical protein